MGLWDEIGRDEIRAFGVSSYNDFVMCWCLGFAPLSWDMA